MIAYDNGMTRQHHPGRGARTRALVLALALLTGAATGAAEKGKLGRFDPGSPASSVREPPRMSAEKSAERSADRIVQNIERKYRAKVVRQETREDGDRKVLVLRLLSDKEGRVWTVRVDAQSGEEL